MIISSFFFLGINSIKIRFGTQTMGREVLQPCFSQRCEWQSDLVNLAFPFSISTTPWLSGRVIVWFELLSYSPMMVELYVILIVVSFLNVCTKKIDNADRMIKIKNTLSLTVSILSLFLNTRIFLLGQSGIWDKYPYQDN